MTQGQYLLIIVLTATVLSAAATKLLIPELKKLKAGQAIREDGPQTHLAKAGTPTMGGIAIIGGTFVTTAVFAWRDPRAFVMLGVMVAFGIIGFLDDFIKVVKKDNLGLRAWQKFGLSTIVSVLIAWYRSTQSTAIWVPLREEELILPKGWFIVFVTFVVLAMTNAVNLTDGLDGLAASVTSIAALCFGYICGLLGFTTESKFLVAAAGACIGFLFFNANPAKVFMGDTGSLALGGALAAAAIFTDFELLLPFIGIIYVCEAVSVILQVIVFQTCHGKRLFRMAPLHHHFELGGWEEKKVVKVFSTVTGIFCLIAMLFIEFGGSL